MRMRITALAAATVALLAWGCGPKQQISADEAYETASENMRYGSYNQAVEGYKALLDEHPFAEHSEEAELMIGVAQYKDNACPEASASLTDFQRRHPTSPYLPMVGYLLGQCAELQMRSADRDQSASQNAHAYYQALIQQFPSSPYALLARDRLEYTRETLATHELDVAHYYDRHDNDRAAEIRLLDLVNRFPETDTAGEALLQLGAIYERRNDPDKAVLAYGAVVYHHPEHEAAREAERALERLEKTNPPPSGDPLVLLRAETGRTRDLAITQSAPKPVQSSQRGGPSPAGSGFGLPGGSGPFGSRGAGPYGGRY
ncbi:MAG: outer membrane protein assembly factor BamD [Candidatus Binatia bacterium]